MTSNIPVYQIAAKYGISKAVISKWKCEILGKDISASRNGVLAKLSLPVRESFHVVGMYF